MTTSEIEAWLKATYPDNQWVVSDKLGVGLPMPDGIMFYHPVSANMKRDIEAIAKRVINSVSGKGMP